MSTVAIFGPGLIGGSLALALRKRRPTWSLTLWARSEHSAERTRAFFPNVSCDAAHVATGADLCVLCTPIGAMPTLARQIAPHLGKDTIVTDAGSAKAGVVAELEAILGEKFVGSHPMAGSEKSGIEAARDNLFEKAVSIITPTPQSTPHAVAEIRSLWETVGCRIVEMDPLAHDEAIACVSHLPHAAAAALVNAINLRAPQAVALAGGGYRDTTRIAAGPPAMWSEILLENRTSLIAGLEDFTAILDKLKHLILAGDSAALEEFLAQARDARNTLP